MHVQVLGSGSGGNSALVRAGETHVLLDAGLPSDELEGRLERARVALRRLDHVVLTHGHLDHARAAGVLSRKSRARIHCAEALMRNASLQRAHALATLPIGGTTRLAGPHGRDPIDVTTVSIPHDAHPTVALRVDAGGRRLVLVTDMGRPDARAAKVLAGAHVLLLEFNHDSELLRIGEDPPKLKRRVAGDTGHLSNAQAAEMLRLLAGPELHTLVLTHLSRRNNRPELALAAARGVLGESHVAIHVASQDDIGENLLV